jgi:hypothetical protein
MGKVRQAHKADNLAADCLENVGASTPLKLKGLHCVLTEIALPFLINTYKKTP